MRLWTTSAAVRNRGGEGEAGGAKDVRWNFLTIARTEKKVIWVSNEEGG